MGYPLQVGRVSRVKCPLIAPTTLPCWFGVTTHRGGGGGVVESPVQRRENSQNTTHSPRHICICGLGRQLTTLATAEESYSYPALVTRQTLYHLQGYSEARPLISTLSFLSLW
jgi:hypothetical protein